MAIYVEYEGIKGDVTAKGYTGQIALLSSNFGVGRGISMEAGRMANREVSRTSVSEVTITKYVDNSSDELFNESLAGDKGKKVTIRFIKTGSQDLVCFMTYTLEDVLISGYSLSADAEGDPVETITLSFAKIEMEYTGADRKNAKGNSKKYGYDVAQGCKA